MTPADASHLLTVAAFYDGRTISEAASRAWAEALSDVDPGEARRAVVAHYRETNRWLMPADIRARVKTAREERIQRTPVTAPDDPDDERAYRAELHRGIRAIAESRRVDRAIAGPGVSDPSEEYRQARTAAGEHYENRVAALRVTCPWCRAHAGERCTVPELGAPLTTAPAHRARLITAGLAQPASEQERAYTEEST